jgi:hypothetical protein
MTVCVGLLLGAQACSMAQTAPQDDRVPATAASRQSQFTPPTQRERTRRYFKSLGSPFALIAAVAGAGISQWQNTPSEWKQGAEGYGKRFANSYGQHIVRQTLMFGASSLLHEDNRYFPSEQSGVSARLKYAIESTFLARRDDGTRHFSSSRIGAGLGAAFISRTWQPRSTSAPQNAISNFGITLAVQTGFNVAREFVPFLRHSR